MINPHSTALAQTLAHQMNVSLESPYNLFTDAIRYSLPAVNYKAVSVESAVNGTANTVHTQTGISQHEGAVNNAVDVLVTGIANQFNYVRETVRPFISTAVDRLINRLKSSTPAEYTVKEFEISDFLLSDLGSQIFKPSPRSHYYRVSKGGTEKDADTILQEVATNIPDIDAALGKVVADIGQQAVKDIYNAVFRDIRPNDETAVSESVRKLLVRDPQGITLGMYSIDEVDFLLLTYYIVEGYLDHPVDGTGLSLTDYQNYLRRTLLNVGNAIHVFVKQYVDDVEKGILYLRRPTGRGIFFDPRLGEITVLKPVYRLLLEKGWVVEQVIGGAIHPKKPATLAMLTTLPAECLAMYRAMDKHRQQQTRLTLIDRINDALRIVLNEGLSDLPADKFPPSFNRELAIANISKVTDILKAYFAEWDSSEELHIYALVTRVICQLIFPFTDALTILETMEEIVDEEDIEPRYAAYYAQVIYLARWMVANFHIVNNNP